MVHITISVLVMNLTWEIQVSGYDNVHLRTNLTHCDAAIKYGLSSGDRWVRLSANFVTKVSYCFRVYTGLSAMHYIITRLYICEHCKSQSQLSYLFLNRISAVSELVGPAEEVRTYAHITSCFPLMLGSEDNARYRNVDTRFRYPRADARSVLRSTLHFIRLKQNQ